MKKAYLQPETTIEAMDLEVLMLSGSADGTPDVVEDDIIFNGIDNPFEDVAGGRILNDILSGN